MLADRKQRWADRRASQAARLAALAAAHRRLDAAAIVLGTPG
jgi:hypothetical protein